MDDIKDVEIVSQSSEDEDVINYDSENALTGAQIIEKYKKNGFKCIKAEFIKLERSFQPGCSDISKTDLNMMKNRYCDVFCLDKTRVLLNFPNYNGSDFINANYIDGYNKRKEYIATQGPLNYTSSDFWQMIWEQNVEVIVMTTKTVERSRSKCAQYWPLYEGDSTNYWHLEITNVSVEKCDQIITTTLLLENKMNCSTRSVTHIHFIGWPDFGVPDNTSTFLEFMSYVRNIQRSKNTEAPTVFHCSAGIGRTGTYIAIDILTTGLKGCGKADVPHVVQQMRRQRELSVQTTEQYAFIYAAIVDFLKQL